MKYLSAVLVLTFFAATAHAQTSDQSTQVSFDPNHKMEVNVGSYESIEGSPYYNKDWMKGYVIFKSGNKSNSVDVKYMNFNNQLLFKQSGKTLAVAPNTFTGFVLQSNDGDKHFSKGFRSDEFEISGGDLLEVNYDGKVKLLTQHENKLDESRPDPLTGKVTREFESRTNHFLVDTQGTFHEIDLDEGDILEALGSYKSELKQFADKNDLDWENQKDLKKILAKYESISMTENSE